MVRSALPKVPGLGCEQKRAKKELETKGFEGGYRFTEERRIKLRYVSSGHPHLVNHTISATRHLSKQDQGYYLL